VLETVAVRFGRVPVSGKTSLGLNPPGFLPPHNPLIPLIILLETGEREEGRKKSCKSLERVWTRVAAVRGRF
jgi:hypothetical protein